MVDVWPTVTLPKATLVGERDSWGVGATPVPLRATGAGVEEELLAKVRLPVRLPPAFGANTTETDKLEPADIVAGRLRPVTENTLPEITTPEIVRLAVPVLRSVNDFVEAEPVVTVPNARLVCDRLNTG